MSGAKKCNTNSIARQKSYKQLLSAFKGRVSQLDKCKRRKLMSDYLILFMLMKKNMCPKNQRKNHTEYVSALYIKLYLQNFKEKLHIYIYKGNSFQL